jgi:hypothetical protein
VIAALADCAAETAFTERVTTRHAFVVAPLASVPLRAVVGTPLLGHAPLATVTTKVSARNEVLGEAGVIVTADVAESARGTSPLLVILKVPVTDWPGARFDQFKDCEPTTSAAVPALIVEPGATVVEALR